MTRVLFWLSLPTPARGGSAVQGKCTAAKVQGECGEVQFSGGKAIAPRAPHTTQAARGCRSLELTSTQAT